MKKILSIAIVLCALFCTIFAVSAQQSVTEEDSSFTYNSLLAGEGISLFTPEDECSVKQLICEAVRLHGIYNAGAAPQEYSWDGFLEYALENDIVYTGLFDSYDRAATRAEAVFVINNAVPSSLLDPVISTVHSIPDADPSAGYYKPVMDFYASGIVEGYDKYGSFRPGAAITYGDFSDLLKKLVNPTLRQGTEYESYITTAPFYLIDDFLMSTAVRNIKNIGSGWRYDYTGSLLPGEEGVYDNTLKDNSIIDNISISRQVFPQTNGTLVLEVLLSYTGDHNGITVSLDNSEDSPIFSLVTENGGTFCMAEGGANKKGVAKNLLTLSGNSTVRVRMEINLDEGKATAYVCGNLIGSINLVDGYTDVAKVTISTGVTEITTLKAENVHLYKNYKVNDVFRVENIGAAPFGYTTDGDITVRKMAGANAENTGDVNSVLINAVAGEKSYANKSFDEISGKVKLEAYMLLPTGDDGAYFTAFYKDYPVFTIESKNGSFYYGDNKLYDFTENIWQCLHIEADTNSSTFLVRINGKTVAEDLPFLNKVPAFDGLEIGIDADSNCTMWFDDVEVHELFEHDDYVPVPDKLETDYYISMSVCNLWRNGSHYGWDYIAPHDDLTPYIGYYDEGSPEVMDWEIKFLAEHGISFYNMCWYAPACPQKNPIKKPRMVDAFHDGYFNARYSDKLDFTIMFENASFKTAESYDSFVENVWPFWVEWYLKDDRYFTIDNKPFLVIYQYSNWIEMCYEKPMTDDMTTAEKVRIRSNAIEKARQLLEKMEQDMIDIGYDGLIVTFTNRGNGKQLAEECVALGADGVFPYNWGSTNYSYDTFVQSVESSYNFAKDYGLDLLSVGGIGFNNIGWKLERWPLITLEEFEDLLLWFRDDFMQRYATKYKNDPENLWKSKFIQLATWNEYGEGHYLFPTNLYGFGYLDVIADVFGKEEHDLSLDIVPTEQQKWRLNHLYPGYRTFIRRQYYVEEGIQIPDVVTDSYDLTAYDAYTNLNLSYAGFASKPACTLVSTGVYALRGVSSTTDPMLYLPFTKEIEAKENDFIHIKMGSSMGGINLDVFFITTEMQGPDENHKFTTELKKGVHDYYIPAYANAEWSGSITKLRIDPGPNPGNTVDFYTVELMNYSDELKSVEVYVDGQLVRTAAPDAIREHDKYGVYIAPSEEDNFYRRLHIVYDWHVRTGKLRLETPGETVFEFEEGSRTVYVNGKANTLDKTFEVYDGCPVIPLMFILKECSDEYNYIYDYTNKTLDIYHLDMVSEFMDLENGDAENENLTDAFYNYNNGVNMVQRVVDPENNNNYVWHAKARTDIGQSWTYFRADTKFEAGKTYTVDFDFKLGKLSNGKVNYSDIAVNVNPRYANISQMETATSNIYDHPASAGKTKYLNGWTHFSYTFTVADDYVTTDIDGKPYTDSINIFINPVKIGVNYFGVEYYVDNFTVRSIRDPFVLYNGDAESDDMTGVTGGSNTVTIETETLADGTENRYWHMHYDTANKESWNYWNQETKFEPGVTYYFEVDVRVGKTSAGESVKNAQISLNARYYDLVQQHLTSNRNEHTVNLGYFDTSDEWTHCKGSFTISRGLVPYEQSRVTERIAFFSNPMIGEGNTSGNKSALDYDIDNFKVYVVKPEGFDD